MESGRKPEEERRVMRYIALVVLMVLAFAVLAVPASAGFTPGVSAVVSVGAEYDQWSALVAFVGTESGDIVPANGVMDVIDGEKINAQVNFAGASGKWQYDLLWSNTPTTKKDGWRRATFNPTFGWTFAIAPEDYAPAMVSAEGYKMPLQLRLVARGAKDDFIRLVIFKVTYSESDVRRHELLYIRPVKPCPPTSPPPPLAPPAPSCEDVENALNDTRGAVNALGQQLADHVGEDAAAHEALREGIETANYNARDAAIEADVAKWWADNANARLDAVESWISQATAGTPTATPGVAAGVSTPPFRTTWVGADGMMIPGPILIRGTENGQVKVGRMPTATATWSSVADGTVFEFWWAQDGANWVRHQTTAQHGREETISASTAGGR